MHHHDSEEYPECQHESLDGEIGADGKPKNRAWIEKGNFH
jgi:hypothetical protein